MNYVVARCRKHCWSAPRAFSQSDCSHNIFVELKIIVIFSEFDFFRNKAKKCGKEDKMRDFSHDCGMVDT